MDVRRAKADDIDAIAEVHVRAWQEAYVGQVPQEHLDSLSIEQRVTAWTSIHAETDWPSRGALVLVDDGTIVGFAHVRPCRDDDVPDGTGEVTSIYLRRAAWGRGGGQLLMGAAVASLVEAGFSEAALWVLDTNERARCFYEAGGWQLDGSDKVDTIGGAPCRELRYRRTLG